MTVRLTARGVALLVAAAGCFVAGEVLGHTVPRVVAGAALAALAAGVLQCWRPIVVSVERTVRPERVERGEPVGATLVVANQTSRGSAGFLALDPPAEDAVTVARLAPGARAVYSYPLPSDRRGRAVVGPLTVSRMDILGLVAARMTLGATSQLWVYPRTHPVSVRPGARARYHHDGVFGEPPVRGSADLREVREYTPGDEPRHIHWRATARTGQLMVRDYVDPAQPRFAVLLDTRARVLSADEFEAAVEVAASLAKSACAQGCRTRLATTAGVDLDLAPGVLGERQVMDTLCVVAQENDTDSKAIVLPSALRDPGTVLVLVTGRLDGEEPAAIAAARGSRRVTVIDVSLARAEDIAGRTATIRESDPVAALAAWNAGVAE